MKRLRNMTSIMYLKETKAGYNEIVYVKGQENSVISLNANLNPVNNVFAFIKLAFKNILLPQGYPDSVSGDYAPYQLWDTLQAFCSTITNTLSTKAILQGVGVGDNKASALGAAITWIMKDGFGMISRILFAWISGTRLDGECKKWRLLADLLNDIAICIEVLILPYFKEGAIKILCLSTALKAIVGVAGGATRAAITQHQAIRNNMADVSAKDGSQETCVNLVASFASVLLLSLVGDSSGIWFLFFGATFLHIFSNYKAVRALNINKFNTERLNYILQYYLLKERILTPGEANNCESVILGTGLNSKSLCGFKIAIGESIEKLVSKKQIYPFEFQLLTHVYKGRKYLLITNLKHKVIYICLDKSFTSLDIVEAYFHAVFQGICASFITKHKLDLFQAEPLEDKNSILNKIMKASNSGTSDNKYHSRLDADVVISADNLATKEFKSFSMALLNFGWNVEYNHLYIGDWRASWKDVLTSGNRDKSL